MTRQKHAAFHVRRQTWKRVSTAVTLVCVLAVGRYLWKWWGPTPYAVAWKFARAWERGDVDWLYALLDDVPEYVIGAAERRRPPYEGFARLMRDHIFRIAPPGTRWQIEVSDPQYVVFRFHTTQRQYMLVPVRRSLDGKWRVSGMDALRTLYAAMARHRMPPGFTKDAANQRFRTLWTSAWLPATERKQF